jgi:hypothetical protein
MKFAHWTAALTLAVLAIAPAAGAADAKLSDCLSMGKQVADALASAQPGEATDQARNQQAAGRNYCLSSRYAEGVAHYTKALQLLGKA